MSRQFQKTSLLHKFDTEKLPEVVVYTQQRYLFTICVQTAVVPVGFFLYLFHFVQGGQAGPAANACTVRCRSFCLLGPLGLGTSPKRVSSRACREIQAPAGRLSLSDALRRQRFTPVSDFPFSVLHPSGSLRSLWSVEMTLAGRACTLFRDERICVCHTSGPSRFGRLPTSDAACRILFSPNPPLQFLGIYAIISGNNHRQFWKKYHDRLFFKGKL